jgi:hypothetical protein
MEALMTTSQQLETQTTYSLSLPDVRRAAAAYEMVKCANVMLETLPIPVLEALRDYAKNRCKPRNDPFALCERHYMEHLDELIEHRDETERLLLQGLTGVIPPEPKGMKAS